MKKIFYLLIFIISISIYSCSENLLTNPIVKTTEGVFILSEGGGTPATSKLSYYNSNKDSFYVNIANPSNLGLYPDGMIKYNNNLYVTEQGNYYSAGKIYKCDLNGTIISQKSFGLNPYSLTISNNKIYVTNGPASNVTVLDINTLDVIKSIAVGVYPQEILSFNNRVYVCNTSKYGGAQDSTVTVIDAINDAVINTIRVKKDPAGLAVINNKLVIGCPGPANTGKLFILETANFTMADTINLVNGFSKDISIDNVNNKIYFISNSGDIIEYNLSNKTEMKIITAPTSSFIYGYAFDANNKRHFLLDAKTFMISGEFLIYNSTGQFQESFATGIAPRRIVLNN